MSSTAYYDNIFLVNDMFEFYKKKKKLLTVRKSRTIARLSDALRDSFDCVEYGQAIPVNEKLYAEVLYLRVKIEISNGLETVLYTSDKGCTFISL